MTLMDLSLDLFDHAGRSPEIDAAISHMAGQCEITRGAVFTRRDVVEAILDLSGYLPDQQLHRLRLMEPSFGGGDFLLPAVERLLAAFTGDEGCPENAVARLGGAVRAVELHKPTFESTRCRLRELLTGWGLSAPDADALCDAWLIHDDFLLSRIDGKFDFVVGNPPYVRQERIPGALLGEYRRRFRTLYDRADLYVPFFERGLDLLREDGVLGYICANRWLKNRYGGPLREKISGGYWLKYFIDMDNADAFHSDVIAYPAITIIHRLQHAVDEPPQTRAARSHAVATHPLSQVVDVLRGKAATAGVVEEITLDGRGSAPLLLDDIPRLTLLRRIEHQFPALEQAGCRVGIGVATGCDRVYIGDMDTLSVEPERKLPLVMARDLSNGEIRWGGKAVLNPFDSSGDLVALEDFPRFEQYLQSHHDAVAARNVAKRNQAGWYRTIDRIHPDLLATPKLLVPDIKGEGVFVIDEGKYYPHHNLYFVTSSEWDLRALRTVLRSSLTLLIVATYCTRMAGGFLRFQAQYLRRIRVPHWDNVDEDMRDRLVAVDTAKIQSDIDLPVFDLYGLNAVEARHVREVADAARVGRGLLQ